MKNLSISTCGQASDIRSLADSLEDLSANELKMILSVAIMELGERTSKDHTLAFCSLCLSDAQLPEQSD